jgi:hypothetical protein
MYSFGMGYEASEKLFIATEVVKEESQPVNITVFMQYDFIKQFFIRGGVSTASGSYFTGVGFTWNKFRLTSAFSWHPQAGPTPAIMLIFFLTQNEKDHE